MQIDEARLHVLTKYSKVKGKVVITQSGHNPIISTFNCLWNDLTIQEKQRFEIFNYKDKEGLIKFNQLTSSDTLVSCIKSSDVKQCGETFTNILHRLFKKVRICKTLRNEEVHVLMNAKMVISEKIV